MCVCVYEYIHLNMYATREDSLHQLVQGRALDCNTLQHTAPHCNTLQHTATHCNTLHHSAPHCTTLQHTATQVVTPKRSALEYHVNTQLFVTIHCNTLQHAATHCNTLHHTATHCNTGGNIKEVGASSISCLSLLRCHRLDHHYPLLSLVAVCCSVYLFYAAIAWIIIIRSSP